jgi:hypothetical protein
MLDIVGVIVLVLQSQLLLFRAQAHGRGALRPGRAFSKSLFGGYE